MPFTIAHAAAAPPLWRLTQRRLVLSALVVGAMSPDFEYLVRLSPQRTISHTPLGVAVLCVPASLAVLGVWHRLVGPAFAPLLPAGWAAAVARPFRFGPLPRFLLVCASTAVGAFSHLAWDSFTYRTSPVVRRVDIFSRPVWAGGPRLYVVAWYASSAVGGLLIGWWLARLAGGTERPTAPRREPLTPALRRVRRRTCAVLGAGAVSLAAANAVRHAAAGAAPYQVLVAGTLGAMTGTVVVAVALGALSGVRLAPKSPGSR
jgi:hypothetical protein